MKWTQRRQRFRALLAEKRCLSPGSVFDPLSARIAELVGFEFGMLAGSTASLTVLGAPDLILLTLSEFAEQAHRINRAAQLPLMVDADHGYGNALNVKRTVEELETAGVAAMTIEDTLLPLPFGDPAKVQVLSIEEGAGKMRAAVAGRQDADMMIVGRTSAMSVTGVEDVIARARAYEEAGVDAFFMVGVKTRVQLEAVSAAVKIPLMLGGVAQELADMDYLSSQRVRVCIQGHLPIAAAIRSIYETMKALRDGTSPEKIAGLASSDLMKQVTRDAHYQRWIKDFLGPKSE